MRIFKQIIEQKLKNERTLLENSEDFLAYQEHISTYLLALVYLGIHDKKLKLKKRLWKNFVSSQNKNYLKKLMNERQKEDYVILEAVNKLDEEKENKAQKWGSLYGDFVWAILSYEHEKDV